MWQGIWLTVHDAYQYLAVRDMFTCEVLSFRTPLLLWTCAWGRRTRHSECCVRQSLTLNHASQCQYRIHFLCFYNIVNVSSRRASTVVLLCHPQHLKENYLDCPSYTYFHSVHRRRIESKELDGVSDVKHYFFFLLLLFLMLWQFVISAAHLVACDWQHSFKLSSINLWNCAF